GSTMNAPKLINGSEAAAFLRTSGDPVTKVILDRANTIVARKYCSSSGTSLAADFDLRFFAEIITDLFADKDLIRRILNGERPGAWSTDDEEKDEEKGAGTVDS